MNTQPFKTVEPAPGARNGPLGRLAARKFQGFLDLLDNRLKAGAIEAILPDGSFRTIGNHEPGPVARVDLRRWRALLRLARSGSVGWYQAWEKGIKSLYYLRSKSVQRAGFAGGVEADNTSQAPKIELSANGEQTDYEECLSCQ